ncbi:MAG: 3,4-dihydroxy-2-butanone-4-phosphate synthase [Rickettsiales bacterium]|nr:3,4-dihydroxy-2-butanone-4-phosphate synthase [Rickettsiales bacterium]
MSFFFSPIEEILKDLSKGRMVVIVDDENRENEGDLIFNAEKVTAEKINFMAKYARGLICLALSKERAEKLDLKLMSESNLSRHKTAFTVSIEAKKGVTTGISAMDRSKTIEVAVSDKSSSKDLVSPGHIFPLVSKDGGVLVRAGHTEAAVDLARLSGKKPSGVICEIMNDDGSMARLKDLKKFCIKYKLKISSIKDLIEYRIRKENFVECIQRKTINIKTFGMFELQVFSNKIDGTQHLALIKGKIYKKDDVFVRMHTFNIFDDFLGLKNNNELDKSMELINKRGKGVIVILRNPKKDIMINSIKNSNNKTILKEYGIGAQILIKIGVKNIILLTNKNRSIIGIDGFGIHIKRNKKLD